MSRLTLSEEPRPWCRLLLAVGLAILALSGSAGAQCPKITLNVDNDIAGSGYSETSSNWASYTPFACHKTYRYLSHTVGDKTRKGKAIWKPKISTTGWYEIEISWRGSTNRTTDADYFVYDDAGGTKKFVVNQNIGSTCTKKKLGSYYCKAGGSCRVVLDGTDDGQSDCADMTTFTLVKCSGTPPANPCAGISKNSSYELCSWTVKTCAGVYKNGDGCKKYCAASNMVCAARFGGDVGCKKEPNTPIACGAVNTHLSDWCECAYPPGLDAGPPPDKALPLLDKALPPPDKAPPPPADKALPPPPKDQAPSPGKDQAPSPGKDQARPPGADGKAGGGDSASGQALPDDSISGGCSCRVARGGPGRGAPPLLFAGALLCLLRGRRQRR